MELELKVTWAEMLKVLVLCCSTQRHLLRSKEKTSTGAM